VKTSKARLASFPRYLSGRSSAFYANRPIFVTKLYIAQIAVKRSYPVGNRPIALVDLHPKTQ